MEKQNLKLIVNKYVEKFLTQEGYFDNDLRTLKFFQNNWENTDLRQIHLKISSVNDLELSRACAEIEMAYHIQGLPLDAKIAEDDLGIVPELAKLTINAELHQFWTFATRYCNYHKPEIYPVFDAKIQLFLNHFLKAHPHESFEEIRIEDYQKFKRIINYFREEFDFQQLNFKDIDMLFWAYGEDILQELNL